MSNTDTALPAPAGETTSTVALRACGCIVGAAVKPAPGDKAWAKSYGKSVADWAARGLTITDMPNSAIRRNLWRGCHICKPEKHPPPPVQQELFGGEA